MKAPILNADGSCPDCLRSWRQCAWHIADGLREDRERSEMLRRVCAAQRADEIGRVCARYELESDEMQTREEKAEEILRVSRFRQWNSNRARAYNSKKT